MKKILVGLLVGIGLVASLGTAQASKGVVYGSVVEIMVFDAYEVNGEYTTEYLQGGSGVLIDKYGTISTNQHVLDTYDTDLKGYPLVVVCFNNAFVEANKCNYTAEILYEYYDVDLAFLRIDGVTAYDDWYELQPKHVESLDLNYASFRQTPVVSGDEIYILGYPYDEDNTTPSIDTGKIIDVSIGHREDYGTIGYYFSDASITFGNSGGGAFDERDFFIGMPTLFVDADVYYAGIVKSTDIWDRYKEDVEPYINLEDVDTTFLNLIKPEVLDMPVFKDVELFDIYYAPTMELAKEGIIHGHPDGSFKPDDSITRAEFAKIVYGVLDEDKQYSNLKNCFPDVKTDWYANYVCTLKRLDILNGYPDGMFRPGNKISYAEASKILANIFYEEHKDFYENYDGPEDWYYPYSVVLGDKQNIPSSIHSFGEEITRGEMAAMIQDLYTESNILFRNNVKSIGKGKHDYNWFFDKLGNSLNLANGESIEIESFVNMKIDGEHLTKCNRTFYGDGIDLYNSDYRYISELSCYDRDLGRNQKVYSKMRDGFLINHDGYVYVSPERGLTIDAKALKVLLYIFEYGDDHIQSIVIKSNNEYELTLDPLLAHAIQFDGLHEADYDNVLEYYRDNVVAFSTVTIKFRDNGDLDGFGFYQEWNNGYFERVANEVNYLKGVDYDF